MDDVRTDDKKQDDQIVDSKGRLHGQCGCHVCCKYHVSFVSYKVLATGAIETVMFMRPWGE